MEEFEVNHHVTCLDLNGWLEWIKEVDTLKETKFIHFRDYFLMIKTPLTHFTSRSSHTRHLRDQH